MQKQYNQLADRSGGTIEERMLEAVKKIIKEGRDGFNLEGDAAKACASIAQEEIDKAVKERYIEILEWAAESLIDVNPEYKKWVYEGKAYTTEQLFDIFIKK